MEKKGKVEKPFMIEQIIQRSSFLFCKRSVNGNLINMCRRLCNNWRLRRIKLLIMSHEHLEAGIAFTQHIMIFHCQLFYRVVKD